MKFDLQIDTKNLLLRMRNGEKRLAYGVANAINETAKRVQQAEFEHVDAEFTIRKRAFFFGTPARPGGVAARIKPFASVKQGRAYAEISVSQKARGSLELLLPVFERGGEKKPAKGKTVAVPVTGGPARPHFKDPVPRQFTFRGMGLVAYRGRKRLRRTTAPGRRRSVTLAAASSVGQGAQWKGRHRTFLLRWTRHLPLGGVFQRTGPKKGDVRLVWAFTRNVDLDARLKFVEVARQAANIWFHEEMEKQVIDAIAHDRGRSL